VTARHWKSQRYEGHRACVPELAVNSAQWRCACAQLFSRHHGLMGRSLYRKPCGLRGKITDQLGRNVLGSLCQLTWIRLLPAKIPTITPVVCQYSATSNLAWPSII